MLKSFLVASLENTQTRDVEEGLSIEKELVEVKEEYKKLIYELGFGEETEITLESLQHKLDEISINV